ncbi:DUF6602 domain-containing protein [Archangium sp.]|uniref:DUF6602 domain-containing protein n=1 Tax=Archangium sp. TaxID=1872627 RepID=UPI002D685F9E|nr:DUF6602 domain-containing protein [Archangium sp.]HYO51919.1 DUF6602 domain-containing protein [Archangium sp.]
MNQLIHERLEATLKTLLAGFDGGRSASSATRGNEREAFVHSFLERVVPPAFRIASGDITDAAGNRSGQLDLVIEFPFVPSMALTTTTRTYLAEGVAAVIEVKSDLSNQWEEVRRTSKALRALKRSYGAMAQFGVNPQLAGPKDPIPFFAVGFAGWAKPDTVAARLAEGVVDGILVIDPGIYVGTQKFPAHSAEGAWSLWCLLMNIQHATQIVGGAQINMLAYAT